MELRQVMSVRFIVEQDGSVERELKTKFSTWFETEAAVEEAYLCRVQYTGSGNAVVALCLKGGEMYAQHIAKRVGTIFGESFGRTQSLDILFLNVSQAESIAKVAHPFYRRL